MKSSHQSRWHRAINPIASYCAANPSARGLILAELNRIAPHEGGRLWNRQQVDRYLYPAGRRTEPLLGIGLALIEAGAAVMGKQYQLPPEMVLAGVFKQMAKNFKEATKGL